MMSEALPKVGTPRCKGWSLVAACAAAQFAVQAKQHKKERGPSLARLHPNFYTRQVKL